ncbi:hypothetical protein AYO44_09575 [Planctomycetaceae bacterium SCGC AG-212-F19]|nr:hypothetical protein AYO44_09575 [Planctomycetaceae bacterium SCGC AG-212-F19]
MNAEEAQPPDETFADLLAVYERALRDGTPPAPVPAPPPDVQARLDEALRCVQVLQQLWPQPRGADTAAEGSQRGQRYRLDQLYATGGVGQVWRATDADLDREVALKELRAARVDATFAARFLQEARITARLQHPGVVPVYELVPGTDGQPPYYTMRLVRGQTLTEAVAAYHVHRAAGDACPLELNALLSAFVSVCHTVAYAHAQGIIHRDLKTANVVLGAFGEVVLLDWGFAQELGKPDAPCPEAAEPVAPGHTATGQAVGTPAYMAPEQAAGARDRLGKHTDVFGLGAILYEILTGRPPFTATDTNELLRQARDETPPAPRALCPAAPRGLAAVCMRALAREPGDRYASATDLAGDVQRWLADEPPLAYRETVPERLRRWGRRHKPLVVGTGALLVTGCAALLIGLVLLEKEQARTAEIRVRAAAEKASADAAAREELESHLYVERLALAERELAAHNLARAMQLLAECPPERRGWEWACLHQLCQTDLRVLRGHAAPVAGAVFVLDGRRIVSAGHDRTLKVWDTASGEELAALPAHADVIHCLAASADGRLVASGSWDRTVKIWDAATMQELRTLTGFPGIVIRVVFAPDRRTLAAVSGSTVTLWDATTGKESRKIIEPADVYGLAIAPDGTQLATGSGENLIRLHDLATGAAVRILRGHRVAPKHLAFSPDGRLLAAGDGDTLVGGPGTVKVWDITTGEVVADLHGHTYPVFAVAFSPDGRRLVSGSQDNSIKVWDVTRKQLVLTLRGHADLVRSLSFSPDGQQLLSASADRTVRVWDAAPVSRDADTHQTWRGHAERVIGVAFTADDRQVASLSYDMVLKIWDAQSGANVRTVALPETKGRLHSFAASPRANLLAAGTSSGAVVLLDDKTGAEVGHCPGFGAGPVKGIAFTPDGTLLAAAEWRNTVHVWDVKARKEVRVLRGHVEPVVAVAFSPDGRLLASASHDQTVKIWDAATGQPMHTLLGHISRLTSVAFAPAGDVLASASNDGCVKLWNGKTGELLRELRGHTGAVGSLAFSPDGRTLFSAGDDWMVRQWDVKTGAAVATIRGHTGAVRMLALDAPGHRLVSGGHDQTVRLWNLSR